jgi:spermidine synthase
MSSSNLKILASESTPLGSLCLRRRELLSRPGTMVTEITLNQELLMSSYYTISERQLARSALDINPGGDLRVLIGGLGLGYTAREVLTSKRVAYVEVVELLPQVIDWLRRGLFPLTEELKADSRLSLVTGDIFARLSHPPEQKFDLILIDVDHSPEQHLNNSSSFFYTEEALLSAREHLAPNGVFAIWSCAETLPFVKILYSVFKKVTVKDVTFKNELIDQVTTDWLFFAQE